MRIASVIPFALAAFAFVACGGSTSQTGSDGASVRGNAQPQPTATKCDFSMCRDAGGLGERVRTGRARDYWAVFRDTEKNVHYTLPRADGAPYVVDECARTSDVARILAANGFCGESNAAGVEKMNALSREDALAIANFLHSKLAWRTESGLKPFPYTNDVEEVCLANPTERAGVLKALCDYTLARVSATERTDEARTFTDAETQALIPLLNALYGIEAR